MLWIVVTMLVILALAALVFVYVAYPYRGERVPRAAWVGEVMQEAAQRVPVLDPLAEVPDMPEQRTPERGRETAEQPHR